MTPDAPALGYPIPSTVTVGKREEGASWRFSVTRTEFLHGSTLEAPTWTDARKFYRGLFGWNTPEGPPEAGGYSVCDIDGKTVAGLGPNMNPAAPPHWSTYVNVDSADDTVAKVEANGGTVYVAPMDVMDAGRMAVFADPDGAVIGLWQPGQHMGAQLVNEPGTYCWSELMTDDLAGAKVFYKRCLRMGRRDAGTRGPGGLHRVEGRREVHRRDDVQAAHDAARHPVFLGRLFRGR